MKKINFTIFLFLFSCLGLNAQNKIFDFETKDSLSNPFYFQVLEDKLIGLNYIVKKDTSNKEECEFKYVIYDLTNGKINNVVDAQLFQEGFCYEPNYTFAQERDAFFVSNNPTSANNRVSLARISNGDIKVYLEKGDNYLRNIIVDIKRPLIGNAFYKMDFRNNINNSMAFIYELFKITIDGDSLEKEMLYTYMAKPQLTKWSLVFDNKDYFTSIHIYEDIYHDDFFNDSLCKFEIFRFDKKTLDIDTLYIENDYNYRLIHQIEKGGKLYFLCYKQDKSIINQYVVGNEATIFTYDIVDNSLIKSDLTFENNVDISKLYNDKYSDEFFIVGAAKISKNPEYDNTYSDYWISNLDANLNLKTEFVWSETNVSRLGESVYNIASDEEGLLIWSGEYDIIFPENGKPNFFKVNREILTTIENQIRQTNFNIYPNPTYDLINISSLELPYSFILFDSYGRIIKRINGINKANFKFNISNLENGMYFIRMNDKLLKFLKKS